MVKYLKYIVLVFGGIGIFAASFFVLQNKHDLQQAYTYQDKFEYDYLFQACGKKTGESIFPCLKNELAQYLPNVSLTGISIGLKMVFNLLEEDRERRNVTNEDHAIKFAYSLYHLEINNMALNHAYRQYFGFSFLYGGFVSSLKQYYVKGHNFSQNIITGLEGPEGLELVKNQVLLANLQMEFKKIKKDYYRIKKEASIYIDTEWDRLARETQNK